VPDWLAVGAMAVIYAATVRASAGGRGLLALATALAIGLAGGVLVLMTAGIAAALMGHAIARFASFMTMGYPTSPEPIPVLPPNARGGATGDTRAWLIPPRRVPRSRDGEDGRGGIGPVRPA
jgi:hypothetical protein